MNGRRVSVPGKVDGFAGLRPSLSSVSWYYQRLRSMTSREVVYRIGEQAKRLRWRNYRKGWKAFELPDGALPNISGLKQSLVENGSPDLLSLLRREARILCERPLTIFGQKWDGGPIVDLVARDPLTFHLDPVSGQHWPLHEYCFSIAFRNLHGHGDSKFCTELNQLQFCHPLAAAAALDQDASMSARVWTTWNAWYESNPPFRGINWQSSVSMALRVVSLVLVCSLIECPDRRLRTRLRTLLNAHGFWLARYPSLHSSANNHLMAESVALFVLGTLMPDVPGAEDYRDTGRRRIQQLALELILADGVGSEMSPSYAAFTIEWVLLAAIVATASGNSLEPAVYRRLEAAADHFRWIMDCRGNVPHIGDCDEGRVISSSPLPEQRYIASIVAAIAGVTGRADLAPCHSDPNLRDIVFGSSKPVRIEPDGCRVFPEGGLSVVRETISDKQVMLLFDHGPLGHLAISAHGHADTLSIWLSIDGDQVLVDAGTYLYYGAPTWRSYFRSTIAHNTVEIGGCDSSTMSGPFIWSRKATGRLLTKDLRSNWRLEADHDGYLSALGVRHKRSIARAATGFVIEDSLSGGAERVRLGFLVHPKFKVVLDAADRAQIFDNGRPLLSVVSLSGWTPELVIGQMNPPEGWYSEEFGLKCPATRIVFSGVLGSNPLKTLCSCACPGPHDYRGNRQSKA
jgi:hypothetical protein